MSPETVSPASSYPPADLPPARARELFRGGTRVPTSGYSNGYAQANMLCLPRDLAFDFLLFAQRNPRSCPVLEPMCVVLLAARGALAGGVRILLRRHQLIRRRHVLRRRRHVPAAAPHAGLRARRLVAADRACAHAAGRPRRRRPCWRPLAPDPSPSAAAAAAPAPPPRSGHLRPPYPQHASSVRRPVVRRPIRRRVTIAGPAASEQWTGSAAARSTSRTAPSPS